PAAWPVGGRARAGGRGAARGGAAVGAAPPGPGQGGGQGGHGPGPGRPGGGRGQAPGPGPAAGGDNAAGQGAPQGDGAPDTSGPADATPAGAGPEASRATGQLGQGSTRHGHLQNAFANVQGDVVVGNKYVLVDGGRMAPRLLSPLVDERVRHAYHEPAEFAEAREALQRQKIIILRGPPGHGKSALAVRLLQGRCDGPIHHLDSGIAFASLADWLENGGRGIEPGAGFLLDHPADIGNLSGEVYEKVQGALSEARAWMVLTVASTEVADSALLSGVLDLGEAPDRRAIARSHIRWRLGGRTADALLRQTDFSDFLADLLAGEPSCRTAASVALVIYEEYDYESARLDEARTKARCTRLAEEDFEIWAEGLPDRPARCFALALAVLNGLPQENVAQAARALERLLEDEGPYLRAPGADGRFPHLRDPFAQPRRRRLARLRAHTVSKVRRAGRTVLRDGEPGDALEYKDPSYPALIIRHAWNQYGIQQELLDWITALVSDRSEQVRVTAAVALGVILTESYTYVCDHLLYAWAYSEDDNLRDAVAYALSVGCGDAWVKKRAAALVESWLADRDEPMGQATAARVHGTGAVGEDPEEQLARLAVVDHWTVAVAVGRSFTDLLADDDRRAVKTLQVLRDGAEKHLARPSTLLAFLIICSQLVVDGEERQTGADEPAWPTLLVWADEREEIRDAFVGLWRDALNHLFLRDQAESVLRGWATLAEKDAELRSVLLLMIGAIAYRDERSGRTLRRFAVNWTDPRELAPLPVVAAAMHAQLDLENV
ncbi:hypothetical protein ACFVJJ_19435, partial [Streptomyces sp. NPDC127532]